MRKYGDIELRQHWLVNWQHKAISWPKAELSQMWSSGSISMHSMPQGGFKLNFTSNFQDNFTDWWLSYLLCNCLQEIFNEHHWWQVSILVQAIAWCHQAPSNYLSQCQPSSKMPYAVTRPQCFTNGNGLITIHKKLQFSLVFTTVLASFHPVKGVTLSETKGVLYIKMPSYQHRNSHYKDQTVSSLWW